MLRPLRARLLKTLTTEDFDAITAKLIEMAKAGELGAIRELFDRLFGKPKQEVTKHVDGAIRTVSRATTARRHCSTGFARGSCREAIDGGSFSC